MGYTTIFHEVRKQFNLSCNEYCVADVIRGLSGNTDSTVPGWCNASRSYLARELDLSRQSIITIVKTLVDKKLIEVDEHTDYMKTTDLFGLAVDRCKETLHPPVKFLYTRKETLQGGVKKLDGCQESLQVVEPGGCQETLQGVKNLDGGCKETLQDGCKETLQGGVKKLDGCQESLQVVEPGGCQETLQGVKNLDGGCKETLQDGCKETLQGGVKKLDTIIIEDNNINDNTTDKEKKEVFPDSAESGFSENGVEPEKPETEPIDEKEKKGTPKKVAPKKDPLPEPSIVTQIRRVIETRYEGYYWQAVDATAAKQLGDKLRHAVSAKSPNKTCSDEELIFSLNYILDNSAILPAFYQFTSLPKLNAAFNDILTIFKSPRTTNGNRSTGGKPLAPGHTSQQERTDKITRIFDGIDKYVDEKRKRGL